MKNIVDEVYSKNSFDIDDFDEQAIIFSAIKATIPLVLENELTEKQRLCFTMFYIGKKSQKEIAKLLGLSQPTVSHHIATAKKISNKTLKYCFYAVTKANDSLRKAQII